MKKNFYLFILSFLFFTSFSNAQTVFSFENPTTYNATTKAYELPGVGSFFRGTSGGTTGYGSANCDGIDSSISTSGNTFVFLGTGDISEITVRGNGTGSNRTLTSVSTSSTIGGTYTTITAPGVGTINGSTCGSIVITPSAVIPAGTYIKFIFSGNLNVTSLLLAATASTPPTVTTNTPVATSITSSGATLGGQITDAGTGTITASGIAYSLSANPTIAGTKSTDGPLTTGAISSAVTGLTFSTTYHARAYATTSVNTSYGADVTFTTSAPSSPTIVVNPTSLGFGSQLINTTSTEKTFTVVAGGLAPASGNISVTAPAGYEVSLTTGSGFNTAISIPYISSGVTSTTIYVHFKPTALVIYTGNIALAGGGATQNVAVTGSGSNVAYTIGDYGSVVLSGNWGTVSTWKLWDGSGFNTTATVVPTTTDNVWINSTDTVNVEASGKTCKNLYVNGRLKSSTLVKSPYYIKVYGNEVNVATGALMGSATQTLGDAADGISIDFFGTVSTATPSLATPAILTITGGGTIGISRLRTNPSYSSVVLDNNVTLNYHGSSNAGNAAGYYNIGDTSTLTINAGKTLTFAPWSCYTPVASSHTNGGAQTINITGTVTFMPGNPAPDTVTISRIGWHPSGYMSLGVNGGKPVNLTINNGGVLNASEFYPNGTKADNSPGTGGVIAINVASGGALNIDRIADFRNAAQTATGAGAFNLLNGAKLKIGSIDGIAGSGAIGNIQTTTRGFSTGGTYAYEGIAAQTSGDGLPATVKELLINNTTGVTLTASVQTTDSLNLTAGILTTSASKILTIGSASLINGGSITSYVNGPATRLTAGTTAYSFPVGKGGIYHPAFVTPSAATASSFTVEYFNTAAASATATNLPLTSVGTSEYWDIVKNSGADASVGLNYDNTLTTTWSNGGVPDASHEIVVAHFTGGNWVDATSTGGTSIIANSVSGTVTSASMNSFSPFTFGLRVLGSVPVNLVSFNAATANGQTKLYWSANNEINVTAYVVEKSIDGITYTKTASVVATNLISNNYSVVDANTATGVTFYRLKIIDKDGRFKYSNIIAINNNATSGFSIFPNPVVNSLYVSHVKAITGAKIEIYGIDGRKIREYQVTKDAVQSTINASGLPKGNYNLVFVNGEKVQHTQFIKQ